MFKPGHFSTGHFGPRHFVGNAAVIIAAIVQMRGFILNVGRMMR